MYKGGEKCFSRDLYQVAMIAGNSKLWSWMRVKTEEMI